MTVAGVAYAFKKRKNNNKQGGGDMEHLGVKSADDSGSDAVGFIRNEGRPVRAVRSKN